MHYAINTLRDRNNYISKRKEVRSKSKHFKTTTKCLYNISMFKLGVTVAHRCKFKLKFCN